MNCICRARKGLNKKNLKKLRGEFFVFVCFFTLEIGSVFRVKRKSTPESQFRMGVLVTRHAGISGSVETQSVLRM